MKGGEWCLLKQKGSGKLTELHRRGNDSNLWTAGFHDRAAIAALCGDWLIYPIPIPFVCVQFVQPLYAIDVYVHLVSDGLVKTVKLGVVLPTLETL